MTRRKDLIVRRELVKFALGMVSDPLTASEMKRYTGGYGGYGGYASATFDCKCETCTKPGKTSPWTASYSTAQEILDAIADRCCANTNGKCDKAKS